MPRRPVLLRRHWLAGHLLALSLIVIFANFGFWQLRRLERRAASNNLIASRMAAAPESLQELLERHPGWFEQLAYRPAFARGRYEPARELLLRSRNRDGNAGWHVLTPLIQENGRAVLVDRGWVPYVLDRPPVADALPPEVTVEVQGLVRLDQDAPKGWASGLAPRDPPEGALRAAYYVDIERLAAQMPFPLEPVYLQLSAQQPANAEALPLLPARPALERGPHLSYALQWFAFALIGLIGYPALLWRTSRAEANDEN